MINPETKYEQTASGRLARALVVDDEPLIAQTLSIALSYENFEVCVARDGLAAIEQASRFKPDVIILDLMLPGMDGIEVCRRLRTAGDVAILILTARGQDEEQIAGLESGADDYLVKPFALPVILAHIRAVLRRKAVDLQGALNVGDLRLDRGARRVARGARQLQLTPREFDLLEMLMAHPRQVFSRQAIMNRVWGYHFLGDPNIVDVYVRYLREKLADEERVLIRSVRGVGYSLEPQGCRT